MANEKRDDAVKKFFKKYDTMDEAEKGHEELEKKLGEQGTELGTLRKQAEQFANVQPTMEQYAKLIEQYKPIVEWYAQNYATLQKLAGQRQGGLGQAGNVGDAAVAAAEATPGYEFLGAGEKRALINEAVKQITEGSLAPWTQNMAKTAEAYAKRLADALNVQQKTFADVMWRTFERALPPEKVAEMKAWHEEALKYADPSKIDPMAVATEALSLRGERDTLKKQIDEMTVKLDAATKAGTASMGIGAAPSLTAPVSDGGLKPLSREERFKQVIDDVKDTHGQQGLETLFPAGLSR